MSKLYRSNLPRTAFNIDEEALKAYRKRFRSSQFMRYVLRPISLSLLVLCLLIGLLAFLATITMDKRWSALIGLFFLIALEAVYTTNWLHHPDRLRLDRTAYRGAELLLLLIIVRIVSWLIFEGKLPDIARFQGFMGNPLLFFLDGPFLITLLLALVTWSLAVSLSKIFNGLEVSVFELRFYSIPAAQRKELSEDQPIQFGRSRLVKSFTRYWIWGAVLLVAIVGLITLDIDTLDSFTNPLLFGTTKLETDQLLLLLLYFGVGFWLLSQAKLMEMKARWLVNDVTIDDQLERNWQKYSLLILLAVGLVASLLPIGPTLTISRIIGAIIYAILFLANILVFLVSLPIAIILALLSRMPMEEVEPFTPLVPPPLAETAPPVISSWSETVAMVFSSAFWSIFLFAVLVALVFFLRERKSGKQLKSPASIWRRSVMWLIKFWQQLRKRAGEVRLRIPVALIHTDETEPNSKDRRRWRFIRVGGLPPREQIRYFYLSTVRRAGDRGVQRDSAQTPIEFAENLKDGWPEVEQEVEELTDAFLKARYSVDPITNEDIPVAKQTWKNLRSQIRKRPTAGDRDSDQDTTKS